MTGAGDCGTPPLPPPLHCAVVGLNWWRITGAPLHRHVRGHAERHAQAYRVLEGSTAGYPGHGPLLHCELSLFDTHLL